MTFHDIVAYSDARLAQT